jgi:hypothetical protein
MYNLNKSWVFFLGWASKVTRKIHIINLKTHSHYVLCLLWPLEWDSPVCSSCGTMSLNWIHVVMYWTQVSIHNLQQLKKTQNTYINSENNQQFHTGSHSWGYSLSQFNARHPICVYDIKEELIYHLDDFTNRCCSSDLIKQESCFIKPDNVMEKIFRNVVSFLHYYAASYPKTATSSASPWREL